MPLDLRAGRQGKVQPWKQIGQVAQAEVFEEGGGGGKQAALVQPGPTTFTGAVTETGCGTSNFADVPDNATIEVTVTADIPSNDIAVDLISGGNVLHHEDTGVGQETFAVPAVPAGTYTVRVCKSDGTVVTPYEPAGLRHIIATRSIGCWLPRRCGTTP